MRRPTAARGGRLAFLWRAHRRGSPLRRRLSPGERLAASALAVLVLISVAGTVLAAVAVHATAIRDTRLFLATSRPVRAVVVGPQAVSAAPYDLASGPVSYPVRLRWTWHGLVRTGTLTLYTNPLPGSAARAWIDSAGRLVSPPWPALEATLLPAGTAAGGAVATAVLCWAAVQAFGAWLLRRRARLWEEEWARVGPLWTGRQGLS